MKWKERARLFWMSFSTGMTVVTLGFLVIHAFFPHLGVRLLTCFSAQMFASALISQLTLYGCTTWPLWTRRVSYLLVQAWGVVWLLGVFGYLRPDNVIRILVVSMGGSLLAGILLFALADRAERRRIACINEALARLRDNEK